MTKKLDEWVAIKVECGMCGKIKTPLWKNARRRGRWPKCCGRQMSQTAFATVARPSTKASL